MSSSRERHSDLDDFLAEVLTTPEERAAFDRMAARVNFGVAVAMMREKRGMTQKQLADASGIGRTVIARLESGDHAPTLVTQTKLAQALNARLDVPPDGQVRFVPMRTPRARVSPKRKAATA